jgi:hypothetical protein
MVRALATKESQPQAVIKAAFSGTSVASDWNVGLLTVLFLSCTGRRSRSESGKS